MLGNNILFYFILFFPYVKSARLHAQERYTWKNIILLLRKAIVFDKEHFLDNNFEIYSWGTLEKLIIMFSREKVVVARILQKFVEEKVGSTLCSKQTEFLF